LLKAISAAQPRPEKRKKEATENGAGEGDMLSPPRKCIEAEKIKMRGRRRGPRGFWPRVRRRTAEKRRK
jgi:hypothetical protein